MSLSQFPEIPDADAQLVAAYRLLMQFASIDNDAPSLIAFVRSDDDDTAVIHQGVITLSTKLVPLLAEEDCIIPYLRALAEVYQLPGLTLPQGGQFLHLIAEENEFATAQREDLPLTIYRDGFVWTLLSDYPTAWNGSDWLGFDRDTPCFRTSTLDQAIVTAHDLRRSPEESDGSTASNSDLP